MRLSKLNLLGLLLLAASGCASIDSPLGGVASSFSSAPTPIPQEMMMPVPTSQVAAQYGQDQYNAIAQVNCIEGATSGACGCSGCSSRGCQTQGNWACPPASLQSYADMPQGYNQYGIDPQEFLCDGGDAPPRAIVRKDDTLAGLEPEDTIVHYTTEAGDIEIQASNRVCVYAPRFASVRKVTGAVAGERAIGAVGINKPVATGGFDWNQPGLVVADARELGHADVARRIDAMRERNRGVRIENVMQLEQASDVLAAVAGLSILEIDLLRDNELALLRQAALAAVTWSIDESVEVEIQDVLPPTLTRDQSVEGFTVYDFPDAGRLRICKLADRSDALPGEVVTFMLRVDNVGDSAVTDVLVSDNLTTRLEYVDGSQTASGGAVFSTDKNDSDSSRLTWKLTDNLRVGESVTIRFRCKVR